MRRTIAWILIVTFGGIGLVFGGVMIFMGLVWWSSEGTGSDGGAGSAVLRSLFHDGPRYFEVTALLEVQGRPIEITRVMVCEPYFLHRFGVGYFMKRWYMTRDAITHRLPDGAGVIIVVPKLCDEFQKPPPADAPPWGAFPELPDGFVPLICWTPDADIPETIECYYSIESLERANSRVRLTGISIKNDPNLRPGKSPDEFGIWDNALYEGHAARSAQMRAGSDLHYTDQNYSAYYLLGIEKQLWSTIPELHSALSPDSTSHFLSAELQARLHTRLRLNRYDIQYAIRGEITPRVRSNVAAITNNFLNPMIVVHPMTSADGPRITFDTIDGLVTYRLDGSTQPAAPSALAFDSDVFPWPAEHAHDSFYDSKSETIFELWRSHLSFHPFSAHD